MSATVEAAKNTASQIPASEAPKTETLKISVKDFIEKGFSHAAMVAWGRDTMVNLAKEIVAHENGIKTERKELTASQKLGWKPFGKLLDALQVRFDTDYMANQIPQGTTFPAYCESSIGKKLDAIGKAAQCRVVYRALVVSGKLPEGDYDRATTDWITDSVSNIIKLAVQKYGTDAYLDCPEMKETVRLLMERAEGTGKKLAAIKASLNGKVNVSGGTLDAKKADELIRQIASVVLADLPGDVFIMTTLRALVTEKKVSPEFEEAFNKLGDEIAKIVPENPELGTPKSETPAAPATTPEMPAAETPEMPDFAAWVAANQYPDAVKAEIGVSQEELDSGTLEMAQAFFKHHGRLPANIGEIDAFAEAA